LKRIYAHLLATLLMVSVAAGFYLQSHTVHERLELARQEVTGYQWNQMNPDNSTGMRISFARMGWYYFQLQPVSGWGDRGFAKHVNDPEIARFATQYTREFALNAGFHNEVTTNAVRSGIWGLLSTLAIFLLPLAFLIQEAKEAAQQRASIALLGIGFIAIEFISGMSTEVLNLKFTATFYAGMLVVLLAAAYQQNKVSAK
jgi:O-antigen ligase